MNPSRFLRAFVTSFVLLLLLDGFWHGGVMADFYGQRLALIHSPLAYMPLSFSPFLLFLSAINAVTLSYFVLSHVEQKKPLADAAWIGALLGFTVTGSINFLNHTLLPRWDIVLVLVDTAWGTGSGIIAALAIATVCSTKRHRGFFGMLKR